ncbi:MAG: hypothetical protein K2I22_08885 [Lachnospiraceae bacterium]|nr:hypothetical protein [Lachnospiraceae bacterium]
MKKKSLGRRYSFMIVFLLMTMALTGCSRQADDAEQNFSNTANENLATNNDATEEENTEHIAGIPDSETSVEYTENTITQIIEGSDGRKILIDAQVHSDGMEEVSCYKYIPEPFTEEHRLGLFKRMHPAENWDVLEAAAYNPERETWEFVTPLGESWIYQITHSEIPGEDVLNHENTTASISLHIKQVFPIVVRENEIDVEDALLLVTSCNASPQEIEQVGLYDIGSIDKNGSYTLSFIHVCEAEDGQTYAKVVFKKILDGMPVTAWHDFSTVTGNDSPFSVKIWGSLFSEEEIGLDKPILSVGEAVAAMQEQIDLIPIQEKPLSVTKISLEYLSVISTEGELLIVPVWRFYAGEDEAERSLRSEEVIAVNAISGELIWENRSTFVE